MAKISNAARQRYFERIQEYKHAVKAIVQREQSILRIAKSETEVDPYKYLALADERLNIASYLMLKNLLSLTLLGVKNEAFLNDARKSCYQSVIYLEEVVSNQIDVPFSDFSHLLDKIEGFEDEKRFHLARKLGFTIQSVEDMFGSTSKWKWSFVELEGRYATVVKNLIDFRTFVAGMDPRVDGFRVRMDHLALVVQLLETTADRYREKYELSTARIDDFRHGISFLLALKRIHMALGETDKVEAVKKKIDVWTTRMETDERTQAKQRAAGS